MYFRKYLNNNGGEHPAGPRHQAEEGAEGRPARPPGAAQLVLSRGSAASCEDSGQPTENILHARYRMLSTFHKLYVEYGVLHQQ